LQTYICPEKILVGESLPKFIRKINFVQVNKSDLKQLSDADAFEVVSAVQELPSDFLVLDSHLFLTPGSGRCVRNLQWNPDNDRSAFKRWQQPN
jgi:hypothetical protein